MASAFTLSTFFSSLTVAPTSLIDDFDSLMTGLLPLSDAIADDAMLLLEGAVDEAAEEEMVGAELLLAPFDDG